MIIYVSDEDLASQPIGGLLRRVKEECDMGATVLALGPEDGWMEVKGVRWKKARREVVRRRIFLCSPLIKTKKQCTPLLLQPSPHWWLP